jgi:hypothetical protein
MGEQSGEREHTEARPRPLSMNRPYPLIETPVRRAATRNGPSVRVAHDGDRLAEWPTHLEALNNVPHRHQSSEFTLPNRNAPDDGFRDDARGKGKTRLG